MGWVWEEKESLGGARKDEVRQGKYRLGKGSLGLQGKPRLGKGSLGCARKD